MKKQTEKEVSFGNYLLSEERQKSILKDENRNRVHHSDYCNWNAKQEQNK